MNWLNLRRSWVVLLIVPAIALWLAPKSRAQATGSRTTYALAPLGLVAGQVLRINVANLFPPDPCYPTIVVYGEAGKVLYDSGELTLPAVQSTFTDVTYQSIVPPAAAAAALRAEVRAVVTIRNPNDEPPDPCIVSGEVYDGATGATTVCLPAVQRSESRRN